MAIPSRSAATAANRRAIAAPSSGRAPLIANSAIDCPRGSGRAGHERHVGSSALDGGALVLLERARAAAMAVRRDA